MRLVPGERIAILYSALTALWLAFVLFLDFQYEKFPRVTLGGLKILLAFYLFSILTYVSVRALCALVMMFKRR